MDQAVDGHEGAPDAVRSLYDRDFYAWSQQQSQALCDGRLADFDLPNLIDEIGGIARHEVRRLESRIARLCHQMLLWDYGTHPRTRCRAETIFHQRRRVSKVLTRCPSLRDVQAEALEEGYLSGRYGALGEDEGLPMGALPETSPYDLSGLMTRDVAWASKTGGGP